jgi:hypothetical protein
MTVIVENFFFSGSIDDMALLQAGIAVQPSVRPAPDRGVE